MIPVRHVIQQLQTAFAPLTAAILFLFVAVPRVRNINAVQIGKPLDGADEIRVHHVLYEMEHVAALLATETVVRLTLRIDFKRRCLFIMEGTARPEGVPVLLHGSLAGHKVNQIGPVPYLFDNLFRYMRHTAQLPSVQRLKNSARRPLRKPPPSVGHFLANAPSLACIFLAYNVLPCC